MLVMAIFVPLRDVSSSRFLEASNGFATFLGFGGEDFDAQGGAFPLVPIGLRRKIAGSSGQNKTVRGGSRSAYACPRLI